MKKIILTGAILLVVLLVAVVLYSEIGGQGKAQKNSICPKPIILETPVDLNKVTSILYPGQVRGGDYKRHGGFRFDNATSNQIEVSAPIEATLVSGSRYLEMGEVQYLLDFKSECGIKFRFDHLLTLAPQIADEMEKLPKPKEQDSRTTNIQKRILIKKGEVIATAVGERNNVFVDFGTYQSKDGINFDLPTDNPICWFDLLSAEDESKVRAFPASDGQRGKESNVCK